MRVVRNFKIKNVCYGGQGWKSLLKQNQYHQPASEFFSVLFKQYVKNIIILKITYCRYYCRYHNIKYYYYIFLR